MSKKLDSGAKPGVGLDIGTMNIVSARWAANGQIEVQRIRDAFLDLDQDAKRSLRLSKTDYIERNGKLVVLGDSALQMANLFKLEARRPLSRGVISSGEIDAEEVLSILTKHVLGEPQRPKEHCFYSVPAAPIDDPTQDVLYHQEMFRKILSEHGYTPHPMNEAMAIIFSQCPMENFSGLSVSFGAGMVNIALAYQATKALEFSLARCVAEDFPVVTEHGFKPICEISVGDLVLDALGDFVPVLEKVDNGKRESLVEVTLEHLTTIPHRLTSDHRVFVQRRFGWEWVEAGNLREGDTVGTPTVATTQTSGGSYYFGRKDGHNITVATARNLGRFFGLFLGDGSCGPYTDAPEFVQIGIDVKDRRTIDKVATVLATLFGGIGVQLAEDQAEGVCRIKLHSTVIARHMKDRFYTESGEKRCPLSLNRISDQMALGVIEGLLDSDGHDEPKRRTITNTSTSIVMLAHHLLNRFGIVHHIQKRPPRAGGLNKRGVRIQGKKDCYEVRVVGHVSCAVLNKMLEFEGNQVHNDRPDFMTYRVNSVSVVPYGRSVFDLRVGSEHHSFSSPGMIIHNCGDWIDSHAAKAVGKTASQMCALKERGIDLTKPQGREQEAIVLYIRSIIDFCLQNISAQFKKVQSAVDLPEPIPFVISGGTTKAEGFLEIFQQEFEKMRKSFPIQVKEIRSAQDPLTAVAEGLLVLAAEEHGEE